MMRRCALLVAAGLGLGLAARTGLAQTAVGTALTYQGELRQSGSPVNGTADLRFRLFTAETNGAQVGSQLTASNAALASGRFTALLDFGAGAFGPDARWLEIDVRSPAGAGSFVTLAPRQRLTAAPVAQFALASLPWSVSGTSAYYTGGNVGVGTAAPLFPLHVETTASRAIRARNTAAGGQAYALEARNTSPTGTAIYAEAESPSTTTITNGVVGISNSQVGRGVYGYATSNSGVNYGVYGISNSYSGVGVYGHGNGTNGDYVGVQGVTESTTTGSGVLGVASATTGDAYGVRGEVAGWGTGVSGYASHPTGDTIGGYFEVASTAGVAVSGLTAALTGNAVAGFFQSQGDNGRGVVGMTIAGGATGTPYGVRGQASTATLGYGVYAVGDMGASGLKPFRIDHPADPENKYLLHYAAESPEVINFYSGKVMLDGTGGALVELPAYFASINKDPRYMLTALGAPMPLLHVAEEISEAALLAGEQAEPGVPPPVCTFRISGGTPGGRVSWRVEALRNDLRVRLHGAPVEREKGTSERGRYQHPEYYGQPPEKGMDQPATSRRGGQP